MHHAARNEPPLDLARFDRAFRLPRRTVRLQALLALVPVAAVSCSALAPQGEGRPLSVLVDVADVSGSTNLDERCAEVKARVRPAIEDPRTQELDLLVLATGGATSEPDVLVPWTTYAPHVGLYESEAASARTRTEWLTGIECACRTRLRRQRASPVYEAVSRALEAITARCEARAKEGLACRRKMLAVQSDLRSTHGSFGAYLRTIAHQRTVKQAVVPARLAVAGIELSFCGVSNTDAGDRIPGKAVRRAWSEVLGQPLVADPTCAIDTPAGRKS